ncbi:hypothetical protein PMAYCL1PPCAC_22891 [Pristionchus mayeri]|uniref:Uncharacterized protein n=1 Tax=Pristionchus mayeri TaxID=1317129 RepID=A0AAN5I6X9_9BILA|nr:hypothetical protein PMAYCL1PPCAC_22891 [Pristionchus mayeri]
MTANEDRPTVANPSCTANDDYGDMDVPCLATGEESIVCQKTSDENCYQYPIWSTLPAISRPFINRLCFHLRNDKDCADLATLAQVSSNFYIGVHNFMQKPENRPGIGNLRLSKILSAINVEIELYPSNIPFYFLDTDRFKRWGGSAHPILSVTLDSATDPLVEQVRASTLFVHPPCRYIWR